MTNNIPDTPQSEERRRFLEIGKKFGVTAAVVAGAAGVLGSSDAAAQTAQEEIERKKRAKHTLLMATGYIAGASRIYPMMQLDLKENIQNMTNGDVYVNLALGRKLGAGAKLAKKVQEGTVQVAHHAISNFAPFVPEVDLINVPYWCAENQKYVNLVTSDTWKSIVDPAVAARGFKVLTYHSTSARTFAVRKGTNPIVTPEDMKGVKFRVPGSKMLRQFYQMLGANPTPIAWGETPSAIKQGVADALDPVLNGLLAAGFKDILSNVTLARSVHGGQVYSMNLEWFNSLPKDTQEQIMFAGEVMLRQNLAKIPAAFAYTASEMRAAGVNIIDLTKDQHQAFVELGGYQRAEWDPIKKELAGSVANFDRMLEAANTQGNYFVHNV